MEHIVSATFDQSYAWKMVKLQIDLLWHFIPVTKAEIAQDILHYALQQGLNNLQQAQYVL